MLLLKAVEEAIWALGMFLVGRKNWESLLQPFNTAAVRDKAHTAPSGTRELHPKCGLRPVWGVRPRRWASFFSSLFLPFVVLSFKFLLDSRILQSWFWQLALVGCFYEEMSSEISTTTIFSDAAPSFLVYYFHFCSYLSFLLNYLFFFWPVDCLEIYLFTNIYLYF